MVGAGELLDLAAELLSNERCGDLECRRAQCLIDLAGQMRRQGREVTGPDDLLDEGGAEWSEFVRAWAGRFGTRPVKASDLARLCDDLDLLGVLRDGRNPDGCPGRIGKALRRLAGQPFLDWRIAAGPRDRAGKTWRLIKEDATP